MASAIVVLRSLRSSVEELRGSIASTRSDLFSLQGDIQTTEAGLRGMSSATDAAVESAGRGTSSVQRALQDVQALAAAADNAVVKSQNKLDELSKLLQGSANIWDQQVVELIEAIKVGAAPVELLIQQFGDALINGKRLEEFLKNTNLHQFRNDLRELIRELNDGKATVDQALKLLGESQLAVAKKLKETIELFRQGKVSLQFVIDLVAQLQRAMPDSDFADLAAAIEAALRKGDL